MKVLKSVKSLKRISSRRSGGWALTESILAMGVGITFLVAVAGIFLNCTISFAEISSYINMDRRSRNALDRMTWNIRAAKQLTSYDAASLVFQYDSGGITNLAYRYDQAAGTLTEEWTVGGATTKNILLTGCSTCAFSLFTRDLEPTTDVSSGQGKVISVAWQCTGQILGKTNSEYMQQSKIVIRNQP